MRALPDYLEKNVQLREIVARNFFIHEEFNLIFHK